LDLRPGAGIVKIPCSVGGRNCWLGDLGLKRHYRMLVVVVGVQRTDNASMPFVALVRCNTYSLVQDADD
jgi:hypothetical protein